MKVSVSDIKNEIREQSCRYYHSSYFADNKFVFAIGHWNVFLGFVPEYYSKSISRDTKISLSAMADAYALISC